MQSLSENLPKSNPIPKGVTYRDFSQLAKMREWTVDMLVESFKGKTGIEDRSDKYHEPLASYFERVLSCQWFNPETRRMEDRSNVVIAFHSIIEFYQQELHYFKDTAAKRQRFCPCGCGRPVFGRQKYASLTCKDRAFRERKREISSQQANAQKIGSISL